MRGWIEHLGIQASRCAAGLMICLAMCAPAFSQALAPSVQPPATEPPPAASATTPATPAAPDIAPSQPAPAVTPAPVKPTGNPGFVEELGKLWKDSASRLSSGWKGSQKTLEDFNAKTKDATESLTRVQSVTTGRTACPMTANGAPDCNVAAEKLCKGKGFKSGKSLDIETAEKCSAKVYLSGRTGAPGECRTENFVTRAICQ
jgi:hypothetical protein